MILTHVQPIFLEFWNHSVFWESNIFSGKKEYLIKWSGRDEDGNPWDNSWEPAKNIEKEGGEELRKFLESRNRENIAPKKSSKTAPKNRSSQNKAPSKAMNSNINSNASRNKKKETAIKQELKAEVISSSSEEESAKLSSEESDEQSEDDEDCLSYVSTQTDNTWQQIDKLSSDEEDFDDNVSENEEDLCIGIDCPEDIDYSRCPTGTAILLQVQNGYFDDCNYEYRATYTCEIGSSKLPFKYSIIIF